jgi:hypothetical protein
MGVGLQAEAESGPEGFLEGVPRGQLSRELQTVPGRVPTLKHPPHLIQGSFLPGFPIPVVVKIPESVSLHHLKPELPADGKGVVAGVLPGLASGAVQGQDPFGTRGKLGDIRAAQPPVVSPDTNPAILGLPLEDLENFHVHGQGNPSVKPVVI